MNAVRLITVYIINIIIIFLMVIIFNYFFNSFYTKYIESVSNVQTYDTFSQDVCKDEHFAQSVTNTVLSNDDVAENETIGYIYFPKLGEEAKGSINQGSLGDGQLGAMRYGVSHDPTTVMPGEDGNVVIAGHREALFADLGQLEKGDLIVVNIGNNVFLYEVESTEVVDPDDGTDDALEAIFGDEGVEELTLYTCYPIERWKAFPYRLVIHAKRIAESDVECSGGINE